MCVTGYLELPFRAYVEHALPEELDGDPFKRTPLSSMDDVLLMGIQLDGHLPALVVQPPPPWSWGRELADTQWSQDVTPGRDCGRESGTVGTSCVPAPVLPDVHRDGGTSDAELCARTFGFYSGSGGRQCCSVCQPCPFWQSHPVSSKRVSCPELPSPLFCSPAVLCGFACMDGTIHTNTNTSLSQPS